VVNAEFDAAEPRMLRDALPQATVAVWPRTGHFPHLAHPEMFAEYLAATDRWPESSAA
jgi:pimeloyl-ACP methyl ester carboxylesterase